MTFAFLGASWLWWLPAALAPVVFHFAWRMRRKRLAVPSLVFFQRISPRLQSRKRLRDVLVLCLRCLVVALVVAALARPTWSGFLGSSSAAIAIVIDNSASMGLPERSGHGGPTRLSAALCDAGALVGALSSTDRAVVLTTVVDPLVPSLTEPTTDKARLRAILDAIRETHAQSAVAGAMTRACDVLGASTASRREIHVLSDLQSHEWDAPMITAVRLPPATTLYVHRIPAASIATEVALYELTIASRGRLSGRPIPVRVKLTNFGAAGATVTLSASDDAGRHQSRQVTISAHDTSAVGLALPAMGAGLHWAQVAIDGDDFALDNTGYVACTVSDRRSVGLCGEPGDFGYLPLAIAPAADGSLSGLTTRLVAPGELSTALTQPPGLALVVMSWEQCSQLDGPASQQLQRYLAQGGRLALCQGALAAQPQLELPDRLGVRATVLAPNPAGEPLIALDERDELLRDLVESDGSVRFAAVRIHRGVTIAAQEGAPWKPLLGLVDGRVLVARRSVGQGQVFCFGIGFSKSWSSLPLVPAFLAISQALALPSDQDQGVLRLRAGESARLPFTHAGAVRVVSISGDALDTTLHLGAGAQLPGFPRAGVYAISNEAGEHVLAAVRCDPDEGRPEVITGEIIQALPAGSYRLDTCSAPADLVAGYRRATGGLDLMPALVVLALLAVLAEGWIANQPLVPGSPPQQPARRAGVPSPATGTAV